MLAARIDRIARAAAAGMDRRQALAGLLAAALGAPAAAQEATPATEGVVAAACAANGVRCGAGTRRSCRTCCSRCTATQENGQRRCACCRDGRTCARDDQCCDGVCSGGTCGQRSCDCCPVGTAVCPAGSAVPCCPAPDFVCCPAGVGPASGCCPGDAGGCCTTGEDCPEEANRCVDNCCYEDP